MPNFRGVQCCWGVPSVRFAPLDLVARRALSQRTRGGTLMHFGIYDGLGTSSPISCLSFGPLASRRPRASRSPFGSKLRTLLGALLRLKRSNARAKQSVFNPLMRSCCPARPRTAPAASKSTYFSCRFNAHSEIQPESRVVTFNTLEGVSEWQTVAAIRIVTTVIPLFPSLEPILLASRTIKPQDDRVRESVSV